MANQKHGEVDWNDQGNGNADVDGGNKSEFMRLVNGSNVVRVITKPYQYYVHKVKFENDQAFSRRIYCSALNGHCAVCELGDSPKRQWLVGILDKKTGQQKILDIGWSIYKAIQTYSKDADWLDPTQYDIDIVRDPNGKATNFYSVVAKPKKPLTAVELQKKDELDVDYLVRRSTPPQPNDTTERFTKLQEEFGSPQIVSTGKPVMTKTTAGRVSVKVSDEDKSDFQDYDQKTISKEIPF